MIVTFTGPSGVGKTTVRRTLVESDPRRFVALPMVTTRLPKPGDDGEYIYVSQEEFDRMNAQGEFSSSTRLPGKEERWYGYRKEEIDYALRDDMTPLLVTDEIMLRRLREDLDVHSVGLLPPGESLMEMLFVLHERMKLRGRDSEEEIRDRLKNAHEDIALLQHDQMLFDNVLVNDDLAVTVSRLRDRLR